MLLLLKNSQKFASRIFTSQRDASPIPKRCGHTIRMGYYEQAFGVDGALKDFWPDDVFDEALLMILIYKKIGEQVDQSIKRDRKFLWLRRLRYFGLALSTENMRIKKVDRAQLRGSRKNFESWFDAFWRDCLRALIDAYHIAVDNDKVTVFALARSEQRWAQVKAKYSTYLELEF